MSGERNMAGSGNLRIIAVRPWGGPLSDLTITNGRISDISLHDPIRYEEGLAAPIVDGRGYLALPSFSDVHAHLDSTRLGLPFRKHTAHPSQLGLINNDLANWRNSEATVTERATYTLGVTIASGTTLVRSHAQVDNTSGLDRLEGVIAAREAHSSRATVEIVAFPQAGIIRNRGTEALLRAAISEGADLIGGIDPCGLDKDPVRHLDVVFDIADKRGVGIDLHLHEPGDLGDFTMQLILERVRSLSLQGRVTISHAFALATLSMDRVRYLADQLAELDVALTTIAPSGNRVLPTKVLADAGVRFGLGQDGIRDYWSPFGDGDMLRRTWQLAFVQQLRYDDLIEQVVAVATVGGQEVHSPSGSRPKWIAGATRMAGLNVGDVADLLLMPGETIVSAVMDCPTERLVIRRGALIAQNGTLLP